ncbi:hypothetical protein BV22DRAFT_1024367 [Leucogyrophana mollusca]|uniref:Uncharacterized protein n=1 Tax=Leucogyrophana mollusca TaxID=85980 RepID=A0ACB8AZ47_9AGAM|nr:hypothetical protein BV22DRAFT_1024367 [Leucogyrophana mollusca]
MLEVTQREDEPANVALIQAGYLGCSALQPTTAISLKTLEIYHQMRRRQASFSIQSIVKVLCSLHNIPYSQTYRNQFSSAFDAYLAILHGVRTLTDQALKRDTPSWRMLHACPPCGYKVDGEPALVPARLHSMDGNMSVMRVNGAGHADQRIFYSDYLITPTDVDRFKDNVRTQPGTCARDVTSAPKQAQPTGDVDSVCTDNWKTANTISENTTQVFDQTGIFVCACRHGIIETLVEMRNSGELAKYALATINKLLDVYGYDGAMAYDIGCSFSTTASNSSISEKVRGLRHRFIVNAFHGHTHNRLCQLHFLPLYLLGLGIEDFETCERIFSASNAVARLIRHTSYFHYLQFLDLHFLQWDQDRYADLSRFIYNNYVQALGIIARNSGELETFKALRHLTDSDFENWLTEEEDYLANAAKEPPEDTLAVGYVEALQALQKADGLTTVQFMTYTPASFTSETGLTQQSKQFTRASKAERKTAQRCLELKMNVVKDYERRLAIMERWTPGNDAYANTVDYIKNREFIRAVKELEVLVVQRLFELAKANLAGTGYKLRKHISNAITRRSAAVRTALTKYNNLAVLQTPPRPTLEYNEVASFAWLSEFEILKHSRHNIQTKPWANIQNREFTTKYYKLRQAKEEVQRLNVEIERLRHWIRDEDDHFSSVITELAEAQPHLLREIAAMYRERVRVNRAHSARLDAIEALEGFTGIRHCRAAGDEAGTQPGDDVTEVEEDDGLIGTALRLESCIL